MTNTKPNHNDLLQLTTNVVSAHVTNNPVDAKDLPQLIEKIYTTLANIETKNESYRDTKKAPAVSVRKSVTPDYLICLEDGKKLKMLKRHLKTHYDMTPEEYRQKWQLPSDYPMVAPNYSQKRSSLAKDSGLGKK